MKKTLSILAVTVLTLGMFSCEAESDVQETEALMAELTELEDQQATGSSSSQDDDRN